MSFEYSKVIDCLLQYTGIGVNNTLNLVSLCWKFRKRYKYGPAIGSFLKLQTNRNPVKKKNESNDIFSEVKLRFQLHHCLYNVDREAFLLKGNKESGESVCLMATGFTNYFYIQRQTPFVNPLEIAAYLAFVNDAFDDCVSQGHVNIYNYSGMETKTIGLRNASRKKKAKNIYRWITGWKMLPSQYKSMFGYSPEDYRDNLLLIYVPFAFLSRDFHRFFESIEYVDHCKDYYADKVRTDVNWIAKRLMVRTFEADMNPSDRFMMDYNINFCSWCIVNEGLQLNHKPLLIADFQLQTRCDTIICDHNTIVNAPLKILSFDIECVGRELYKGENDETAKSRFPVPKWTTDRLCEYARKLGLTNGIFRKNYRCRLSPSNICRTMRESFLKLEDKKFEQLCYVLNIPWSKYNVTNNNVGNKKSFSDLEQEEEEEEEENRNDQINNKKRSFGENGNLKNNVNKWKGCINVHNKALITDDLVPKLDDVDPVVIISFVIKNYGNNKSLEFDERFVLTYECPLPDSRPTIRTHVSDDLSKIWKYDKIKLFKYDTEAKLIYAFTKFIKQLKPDAMTGWYTKQFDIPYLWLRKEWLSENGTREDKKLMKCVDFGLSCPNVNEYKSTRREIRKFSKQGGERVNPCFVNTPGIIYIDGYDVFKHDTHFGSGDLKLNSMALEYLSYETGDVERAKSIIKNKLISDNEYNFNCCVAIDDCIPDQYKEMHRDKFFKTLLVELDKHYNQECDSGVLNKCVLRENDSSNQRDFSNILDDGFVEDSEDEKDILRIMQFINESCDKGKNCSNDQDFVKNDSEGKSNNVSSPFLKRLSSVSKISKEDQDNYIKFCHKYCEPEDQSKNFGVDSDTKFSMRKLEFDIHSGTRIWKEGGEKNWMFSKYCYIDACLPTEILEKAGKVGLMFSLSRLCNISLDAVFSTGVQNRVLSLIRKFVPLVKNGILLVPDYGYSHLHWPGIFFNVNGVINALKCCERLKPILSKDVIEEKLRQLKIKEDSIKFNNNSEHFAKYRKIKKLTEPELCEKYISLNEEEEEEEEEEVKHLNSPINNNTLPNNDEAAEYLNVPPDLKIIKEMQRQYKIMLELSKRKRYGGGRVIPPKRIGLILNYMTINDFQSLYPMLILTLYLCYSNFVNSAIIKRHCLKRWQYIMIVLGPEDEIACGELYIDKKLAKSCGYANISRLKVAYWVPDRDNVLGFYVDNIFEQRLLSKGKKKDAIKASIAVSKVNEDDMRNKDFVPNGMPKEYQEQWLKLCFDKRKNFREYCLNLANIYDSKQLAEKLCLNGMYGFTGAQSALPCPEIAASTTSGGRKKSREAEYMSTRISPIVLEKYEAFYRHLEKLKGSNAKFCSHESDESNVHSSLKPCDICSNINPVKMCQSLNENDRIKNRYNCSWLLSTKSNYFKRITSFSPLFSSFKKEISLRLRNVEGEKNNSMDLEGLNDIEKLDRPDFPMVNYGDTDSIFVVLLGICVLSKAMILDRYFCSNFNSYMMGSFRSSRGGMKLLPENTFYGLLQFRRKGYCGLKRWDQDYFFSWLMKKTGIETERGDALPFVVKLIEENVPQFLADVNIGVSREEAVNSLVNNIKKEMEKYIEGKIPLSQLIVQKKIKKAIYVGVGDHVSVRDKKIARGETVVVGDTMRIVYLKLPPGSDEKASSKAEDADYAVANNLPIDYYFILTNKIMKPVCRILAPIVLDYSDCPYIDDDILTTKEKEVMKKIEDKYRAQKEEQVKDIIFGDVIKKFEQDRYYAFRSTNNKKRKISKRSFNSYNSMQIMSFFTKIHPERSGEIIDTEEITRNKDDKDEKQAQENKKIRHLKIELECGKEILNIAKEFKDLAITCQQCIYLTEEPMVSYKDCRCSQCPVFKRRNHMNGRLDIIKQSLNQNISDW